MNNLTDLEILNFIKSLEKKEVELYNLKNIQDSKLIKMELRGIEKTLSQYLVEAQKRDLL